MEHHSAASTKAMRRFWDSKARENAMWYVHSVLDYSAPDADEFWRSGEDTLKGTLQPFGLTLDGSERVLDIGCGIGRITQALSKRAGYVVGIDVSEEMVAQGREALTRAGVENVELRVGNGRDLAGIPDEEFDAVYSFIVFQHIPDPQVTCGYIREIGRVLRRGGWAVFQVSEASEIDRAQERRRIRRRRHVIKGLRSQEPSGTLKPQWLGSAVRREDLLAALDDGGLELESSVGDGTQFCLVHARRA